jgi:hypothetical protein
VIIKREKYKKNDPKAIKPQRKPSVEYRAGLPPGPTVGGRDGVTVGGSVAIAVGGSVAVVVGGSVAVAVGGSMVVATGQLVAVLVGIQPPRIKLPKIDLFSGDEVIMDGDSFCREALTALNERQVNGINSRIINTSSASRRIVERFFLLSIRTS